MIKEFKIEYELDQELINAKSKEFAEQALVNELKEYYIEYGSPFRKALKEKLREQEISVHIKLPDILETLNRAIEKEHSSIVENFINSSFIDDIRGCLNLQPKEIKFSQFLKQIMEADYNFYESDLHKYSIEVEDKSSKTKEITITFQNKEIETIVNSFDEGKTYEFCRKPYKRNDTGLGHLTRIESCLLSYSLSGTRITEFDIEDFYSLFQEEY